jgi:hypothetical protein
VEKFLLAFDTDLAPIVGQQVTLTADNSQSAAARIDLLIQRASTPFISRALDAPTMECDLVARTVQNGRVRNFLYDPAAHRFIPDDGTAQLSSDALRALAATPGQEVTYTAATPGSGTRMLGVSEKFIRNRRGR